MSEIKLSEEYVRGLVEGEGCFTFDTKKDTLGNKVKIPTFVVAMHERDVELLRKVRKTLSLSLMNSHSVYVNKPYLKDGANRGKLAKLIIRDHKSIKDKIIPFFYQKLHGNKGKQFAEWLEKIGDENIHFRYKEIYKLYKSGYYDKKLL